MRYLAYSYFLNHYLWVEEFDFDSDSAEPVLSETGFNESQARSEVACEQRLHPDKWMRSSICRMVEQADRLDREGADCL